MQNAPPTFPESFHSPWDRADGYAPREDTQAHRLAMIERLAEIGMGLAEALLRQVKEPGAPVVANDVALAYSRIARGVRLTLVLAQRIEAEPAPHASFWDVGVTASRCAAALSAPTGAAAAADAQSAPPDEINPSEAEQRETGREGLTGDRLAALDAGRDDGEASEAAWLTRPLADLAAQICRDLGVPFDAAVWEDQDEEPLPPRWGKGRVGGECTEMGREALVGADAISASDLQRPANTPIPPLPPSRGKDAILGTAQRYRPPQAGSPEAPPPPSVIGRDAIIAAIRKHQPP